MTDLKKMATAFGVALLLLGVATLGTMIIEAHSIENAVTTDNKWTGIADDLNEHGGKLTYARTFDHYNELITIEVNKETESSGKRISAEPGGMIIYNSDKTCDFIPYDFITFIHIYR